MLGFILAAAVAASAPAQDLEDPVIGIGGDNCAAWSAAWAPGGDKAAAYSMVSWVLGFIQHSDLVVSAPLMRGQDPNSLKEWTSQYCAAHPLDSVFQAAMALETELIHRAGVGTKP